MICSALLLHQNGAGKSTLIKICTGDLIPDSGSVSWQPKITIGYLDQFSEIDGEMTVKAFLQSAFAHLYAIEERILQLYTEAENGDMEVLKQAAQLGEKLEVSGFYQIDTRIQQAASGLGLLSIGFDRPIGEMSGGQRAKMILAKLLLEKPDVMLLDEPTNFLDKEHVSWLSEYLSKTENAFMIVSHDRDFLEKVSTQIAYVDNKKIAKYYGTYSEFQKKEALLREDYIRKYSAQQKEIKKTEEFIRKNIAGVNTKMARGRRTQLERIDKLEALENRQIKPSFSFPCLPTSEAEHLTVKRLSVGYHYPILSDISFSIKGGQKVVITGFNGIGKTTLLRTLTQQLPALQGSFKFSEQVVLGYFEQDSSWDDEALTPIQIISEAKPSLASKEVRRWLFRSGISSKHAQQGVGTLSGGEQAKVKMCLLQMKPCNFLIMDEPTNHLDAQAKESLETALSEFDGTVLLVSHEEAFYKNWAQRQINIENIIKK